MTAGVTDDVWATLDHRAGALLPKTRRRVIGLSVVVALLLVALGAMRVEGLIRPNITAWTSSFGVDPKHHTFEAQLDMSATGWVDPDLRDVHVVGHGYRLLSVVGVPRLLPRDHRVPIVVRVLVTDCTHPPRTEPLLRFRVHQWWGMAHVDVQTPPSNVNTRSGIAVFMDGPARVACGLSDLLRGP